MHKSKRLGFACSGVLAALATTMLAVVTPSALASPTNSDVVVEVRAGSDPAAVASSLGVKPQHTYQLVLNGFAATVTPAQMSRLTADPRISAVATDRHYQSITPSTAEPMSSKPTQFAQVVQRTMRRVGVDRSPTANINGKRDPMKPTIAVFDSGIQRDHPDLNVVGGIDCVNNSTHVADPSGHGTFVAGLAAAKDNKIGVVGVAPWARLLSVRVVDTNGIGSYSDLLCGMDWVLQNNPRADVVNMSLGDPEGSAGDGNCGRTPGHIDLFHSATCRLVDLGVVVVVSAGNDSSDTVNVTPANYDEVITVSAYADFDGLPGGLSPEPICASGGPQVGDDTFAYFSNYGQAVDITAPGVCVTSTYIGSWYATSSGTSFSAPIVAGAAALYLQRHPNATPAQVRQGLIDLADHTPTPGDPDAYPEPSLDVSNL